MGAGHFCVTRKKVSDGRQEQSLSTALNPSPGTTNLVLLGKTVQCQAGRPPACQWAPSRFFACVCARECVCVSSVNSFAAVQQQASSSEQAFFMSVPLPFCHVMTDIKMLQGGEGSYKPLFQAPPPPTGGGAAIMGQAVCMGPAWGPKTKKYENGISGISAVRGVREVVICPLFDEKNCKNCCQKRRKSRSLKSHGTGHEV